ncbi:MBL fold metallo-hydrolase [Paraglaciecola aquimarina]|uniref:MBL fold metallo-hydrolase n=1 Tax=Paraglaciecola algarum TaxID=3050085 RepID=A0ABS9D3H7_9ALTE|nr:MBL fold metallo-hydrolase [Paraglaciecola sp. G1-23]MCF2947478.1 MBL fold metallo-hydrolase [Paraglaciecola sp. G1-23]
MKIHTLSGYIQSIYLVEYPNGLLLLDGCCRADVDFLESFITQTLHRPLTDLKLVVVTHMHPDHAGAAAKLRQLTHCKIVTSIKSYPWYRGIKGRLMHMLDLALAYWVGQRLGRKKTNLWYSPVLQADYQLQDFDCLPGFPDWQVITTPGHTDRDLSVLHTPSKRLYVADLIVKVKNRFVPPLPVFHPNQYLASLQKVKAMDLNTVLLAHGGEVLFKDINFEHLLTVAPRYPRSTLSSTTNALKQVLLRKRRS